MFINKIELVDNEFRLLNVVVDVAFKFDIDVLLLFINNILFVDKLFKLLNIVVDVAFILLIDNIELLDNEFKFELVAYTDKSGLFVIAS